MMKRIIKLLEYLDFENKNSLLFNPSLLEVKRLVSKSLRNAKINNKSWKYDGQEDVRFLAHENNYYFADANEYTHQDMAKELSIPLSEDLILGGFKNDGYVWFYKYMLLDYLKYPVGARASIPDDRVRELFKQTIIGKLLSPAITKLEYE